jgi:preprotein translocase subunit YajC
MKIFTLLTVDVNGQEQGIDATSLEQGNGDYSNRNVTEKQDPEKDAAKDQQPQPQGGSSWSMWIMLALIFGVMWFFMIRPQRKQQKELQKFRDGLKKGDKVVTIGGIYGTTAEIKDASVLVEVDNGVKIRVSKQALIKDFSESQQ